MIVLEVRFAGFRFFVDSVVFSGYFCFGDAYGCRFHGLWLYTAR